MIKASVILLSVLMVLLSACAPIASAAPAATIATLESTETPFPMPIKFGGSLTEEYSGIGNDLIKVIKQNGVCYFVDSKVLLNLRSDPQNQYNVLSNEDSHQLVEKHQTDCKKLAAKARVTLDKFEFYLEP